MELGLWLLISCVIAGGVLGGVLRGWSVMSRLHSLEVRVNALEGIQTKLTKTVAATARWSRPDKLEQEAEQLRAAAKNGAGITAEPAQWWK